MVSRPGDRSTVNVNCKQLYVITSTRLARPVHQLFRERFEAHQSLTRVTNIIYEAQDKYIQ